MTDNRWKAWQFLLGEWEGEGSGKPGEGKAVFSFYPDLQENVLVRRNRVDYPATDAQPAWFHEDLLIVYPEQGQTRAIYFDNEGHVIHYTVDGSEERDTFTFVSEAIPMTPRFRLSYCRKPDQRLWITFEIAPPGQLDNFSIYTEGSAWRK